MHRVDESLLPLHKLAPGGTAVGTGLNTHPGTRRVAAIADVSGHPFETAPNKFAQLACPRRGGRCVGRAPHLAGALMKIANDVRWLASGPRCGIGELVIPANGRARSCRARSTRRRPKR